MLNKLVSPCLKLFPVSYVARLRFKKHPVYKYKEIRGFRPSAKMIKMVNGSV